MWLTPCVANTIALCGPLPCTPLQLRRYLVLRPVCRRLKAATRKLILAWLLASACLTGHLGHLWHGAPQWVHLLGSPPVHATMSAAALLGEAHVSVLPLHQRVGACGLTLLCIHSSTVGCCTAQPAGMRPPEATTSCNTLAARATACPAVLIGPCAVQGLAGSSCLTASTPGDGVPQT